jgi:hypothetical protein
MSSRRIIKVEDLANATEYVDHDDRYEGAEKRYCCLFCDDTKYHLYVNLGKKVFHCFKCDARGKVIDSNTTKNLSSTISHSKVSSVLGTTKAGIESTTKKIIKNLPRNTKILSSISKNYLSKRGISPVQARYYGIRESLETHMNKRSIIFPVEAREDDSCEYYVERLLEPLPGSSKYRNAPWSKEGTVYFVEPPKIGDDDILVICEGCFDAISIARQYYACGLLGKSATHKQIDTILGYDFQYIVIMLDPDAPTNALKLRADLMTRRFVRNKRVFVAQATLSCDSDPGDATEAQIKEAVEDAMLLIRS